MHDDLHDVVTTMTPETKNNDAKMVQNGLKTIQPNAQMFRKLFENDSKTEGVVIIGEIGGQMEIEAAHWAKENMSKPIAGFIAGQTAPPGKRMGHAGAIVSGGNDTAEAKVKVLKECGISVSESVADIGSKMKSLMN